MRASLREDVEQLPDYGTRQIEASPPRQQVSPWREAATPRGKARQRASYRLRDLFDHLENAETTLELLSEQNYMLRVKVLQSMRERIFSGLVRRMYNEWTAFHYQARKEKALMQVHVKLQERIIQKLAAVFPSPDWWRRSCFHAWKTAIDALRQENQLLDELEGHRRGRGEFIKQYRELEAKFIGQRDRANELELQIKECVGGNKSLEIDLSNANQLTSKYKREIDELKAQSRVLADQLGSNQDRSAELNREVKALNEKVGKLQQHIKHGQDEKQELSNQLLHMEEVLDDCRRQMAHHDNVVKNYENLVREKELKIENCEAQLLDSHHCIQALSVGAGDYLHKVLAARKPTLNALEEVLCAAEDRRPLGDRARAAPASPRREGQAPRGRAAEASDSASSPPAVVWTEQQQHHERTVPSSSSPFSPTTPAADTGAAPVPRRL